MEKQAPYRSYTRISAIQKASMIMEYLSDKPSNVTSSIIALELNIPEGTVLSILHSMIDCGWVEKSNGGYELGGKIASLWAKRLRNLNSKTAAIQAEISGLKGDA